MSRRGRGRMWWPGRRGRKTRRATMDKLPVEPIRSGMQRFAELAVVLGTSTKTNDRLAALENYFTGAEDADKVWVIALFSGRRPKRTVNTTLLWEWCRELTGLPGWLFEESYHTVGDLAETIALLLPEGTVTPGDVPATDVPAADVPT